MKWIIISIITATILGANCNKYAGSAELSLKKAEKSKIISDYYDSCVKMVLQEKILDKGERVGGRGIDELRKIYIEVGLLPMTHGSSLFQRGETQALGIVTLSGPGNKLTVETMEGEKEERYFGQDFRVN